MIELDKILLFDGAMGTMLQRGGLELGTVPETLNVTAPEAIEAIHREYLAAGADVILANTFGANRFKAEKAGMELAAMVEAGVKTAKRAIGGAPGKYAALDIGPCGRVLQPAGDLPFDEAVAVFAEIIRAGTAAGADFILLETFTDLYELKAAVIAAKENSDLPIFATMSFEANGTTFFGASVESMVMTLEALGVSALGVNCSLGPKQLVPVVDRILAATRLPVLVQPNAGLPVMEEGVTRYDITPEEFAACVKNFVGEGVRFVGGCCGTTPEYIKLTKSMISGMAPVKTAAAPRGGICSPSRQARFERVTVIGEWLNPTGKKALQAALRAHDMDFVLREAIREEEQGAEVLDINMGLPDIDEPAMLAEAVREIQAVTDLPLQLDSASPAALERAARIYNGKPLLNSVNGKKESLDAVLPIAKKYGCAVLGLTLDENGIPKDAEARLAIARRIVAAAEAAGLRREDIFIDCLMMTVSAQPDQAHETMRAISLVKRELGVKTVLGVSNVSFGLPARPIINRTMLAMALASGLDAPIMNPGDAGMTETVAAARVLLEQDADSKEYIEKYGAAAPQQATSVKEDTPQIGYAIARGLKDEAAKAAATLLIKHPPLEIVEREIIPALDAVGKDYENGKIFLPQLIKSAEAAKAAFEVLRAELVKTGGDTQKGKKIVIATVHGDIHDIGKNIVKVILENYNFNVTDLGKDVPPQRVLEAVRETGAKLVGLSALMTTTVASMKDTIELLRKECPDVKVIVGGAVLTESLAEYTGADRYAKDAMETVRHADSL
ncbi:homocysteine S-methyltransferase family protein [Cloacibacillus sp.]|uniref:homocysteine S-methyltransferase family protein n=1 Tax=Cloacibacillus sp. TaxID=2049023 RepID=UPI0025BD7763|nr:homocysteine S-methyltransferase family protein [Cloacibacillus sp.]MCC8059052.1 homocysteine S-methyltransferase family protein [Cloacibacillus sp.]